MIKIRIVKNETLIGTDRENNSFVVATTSNDNASVLIGNAVLTPDEVGDLAERLQNWLSHGSFEPVVTEDG